MNYHQQHKISASWESAASYFDSQMFQFIDISDQSWICFVIDASCNCKQTNQGIENSREGRGCLISCLWHCGLMCRRYWAICEVFTCLSLISSCSPCSFAALVVAVNVAVALSGIRTVSVWMNLRTLAPVRWPRAAQPQPDKNKKYK